MRISQLKEQGALYIEQIQQGFSSYSYKVCQYSAEEAFAHLLAVSKKEDIKAVYVDFYYHRIDQEAKERLHHCLTEEEIAYIQDLTSGCEDDGEDLDVIFPVEEKLLAIVTRLNAEAMLFSTIYMIGNHHCSTWWGNYNQEYVIFTK